MKIEALKIGGFTLGPLATIITGEAVDSEIPDEMIGTGFEEVHNASVLKGQWPPSASDAQNLAKFTEMLSRVEEKTGAQFSRDVMLVSGESGHIGVDGNKGLQIEYSVVTGKTPLTLDDIEGILCHEAGHVINRDLEHQGAIGTWTGLMQQISMLAAFYQEEPDKFSHLVNEHFGSVTSFEAKLQKIIEHADIALAPIEKHSDFYAITDLAMLQALTNNNEMSDALLSLESADMNEGLELTMAFHMKSNKQKALMQKAQEIMGAMQGIDIGGFMGMQEKEPNYASISSTDKQALDRIHDEFLIPVKERTGKLIKFAESYSQAAEFRADDIAVINAPQPKQYAASLPKLLTHIAEQEVPPALLELQKMQQQTFTSHPDMNIRVARANALNKRLDAQREMLGESGMDIHAAIVAVNKEMASPVFGKAETTERIR